MLLATSLALVCACRAGSGSSEKERPSPARTGENLDAGAAVPEPEFKRFSSLGQAIDHIRQEAAPRVIGFGEFHQTAGAKPVLPTMERFTEELDTISRGASDLIVETWVEEGNCGAGEEVVNQDVRTVTERPPVVENQLMTLLTGARARGVQPHVMTMTCADYAQVLQGEEVDYEKFLRLIKHKLAELMERVWRHREGEAKGQPGIILLYGGALHNDIHPHEGIEDISYAADVRALAGDGFVEVDLYVPEYIEGNALMTGEPWYSSFLHRADTEHVLVYERAPRSYVVILRKDRFPRSNQPQ